MSLVTDRCLSAREFLDECIGFKRDHAAQSHFLRGLVMGKLDEPQLKRWAKDFYYYVEPAIPDAGRRSAVQWITWSRAQLVARWSCTAALGRGAHRTPRPRR